MKQKGLLLLIGTLVGLILIVIILLVILYVIAINVGYAYALMIDAGSTSSKVSVMRWRDWPFRSNGYMEELTMEKVEPGISASKDTPQMAYNTLKPTLTKLVNKYIPTYKQNSAVLYLGATAGMRLVNLESPLKADAIIDDLRRQLQNTGLTVSNPYSDIRIINGNDEGIFAWITVNYLSKKLGDESGKRPEPPYQMMGALDLGGASTQITFVPANASSALYTGRHHLFGDMYTVYSYSFLCYGKSAGENRIWAEIIGKQTTNRIKNPCLLRNYELTVKKSQIFTEPCVTSKFAEAIFGKELTPDPALDETITFVGTGDHSQCQTVVQRLFRSTNCTTEPCSFNGVYQPPPQGKFYAFAGFYFVIDFLFPLGGKGLTRDKVKAKVQEFCGMDWKTVSPKYPAALHANIGKYCFDGVYIDALLDGYGFKKNEDWQKIEFVKKVAGASVSWALGYVIDASGKIQSLAPKIDLGQTAFIGSVTALSIVFVALLGVLIYLHLKK